MFPAFRREDISARRKNVLVDSNRVDAFDVVLFHCFESYFLSGKEMYSMEAVCRSCIRKAAARDAFRRWIIEREGRRVDQRVGMRNLYAKFNRSRLYRCFLRYAQHSTDCVIAGSYPASCYLASHNIPCFPPGDIDIFCHSPCDVESVLQYYFVIVAEPLGLSCRIRSSHLEEYESDFAHPFASLLSLRRSIKEWVQQAGPELGDTVGCYQRVLENSVRGWQPPNQPSQALRPYKVEASVVIRAVDSTGYRMMPINIILVAVRDAIFVSHDVRTLVCSSFDFTLCCVAPQVLEDHRYEYSEFNGAFAALRNNMIVLTPFAFSNSVCPINVQLIRLIKYMSRGFTLQCAELQAGSIAHWHTAPVLLDDDHTVLEA